VKLEVFATLATSTIAEHVVAPMAYVSQTQDVLLVASQVSTHAADHAAVQVSAAEALVSTVAAATEEAALHTAAVATVAALEAAVAAIAAVAAVAAIAAVAAAVAEVTAAVAVATAAADVDKQILVAAITSGCRYLKNLSKIVYLNSI
jgi:hypothetical protein